MRKLTIASINANGKLRQEAIDSILYYCKNTDILFVTETWLPPDKTIPTHWQQFHIYGEPVVNADRCQMGISLFINPSFKYSKLHVDTQKSKYYMTCHLDSLKIHCVYLPPSPSLDNTTTMQILESIPLTPDTILCGDFNARMGKVTGDSRWNPRGSKLSTFIEKNSLINHNTLLQYAKPTRVVYKENNNITETSIVDYFISQSQLTNPSLNIRTDLSVLGSDHKLMVLSFDWINHDVSDDTPPDPLRRRWKLSRLAEMPVRTAYIITMQKQFYSKNLNHLTRAFADFLAQTHSTPFTNNDTQANADTIEFLCQQLYDSIYYALDTVLTPAKLRPKTWKWFWNPKLQEYANLRQACYTRWRKSAGIQKPIWWTKYKNADHQLKTGVRQARALAYHNFCSDLNNDPLAAMPTIKRIIQSKTRSKHRFSSAEGPQQAVNEMANFLQKTFDGNTIPKPKNIPTHLRLDLTVSTNLSDRGEYDFQNSPFTIDLVKAAIRRLARSKSPGKDHFTSEMLSPVAHILSPILTNLFRACWLTGYTPIAWRTSQVVPLFKRGNPLDASSYRPISLTSVFRKVLEYCIQQPLYDQSDFIDIAQGGFKPFLSALDQAACLDELIHRYHSTHYRYPTVAFLDIAKAYDTVDRDIIWDALHPRCDPLLLTMLKNLFDDVQVQVINDNYQSFLFSPTTGVLQGSILSPHLYSIYINTLPQLLRSDIPSTSSPPLTSINCLLFADDVALLADPDQMQHLLNKAERHSLLTGYRWSPSKCAIISSPSSPSVTYKLYDTPIPAVDTFKYLGVQFNHRGIDTHLFINYTKDKVQKSMYRLHNIGARSNGFSPLLSMQVYRQFIRPQIEYGLCITNINTTNMPALERMQDNCLRLIVGGHSTSSVKALRVMLNLPTMVERWYVLNTKYNLRLKWLPQESLIFQIHNTNTRYSRLSLISKKNPIYHSFLGDTSNKPDKDILKQILFSFRSQALINSSEKMMQACRHDLSIDPIFFLPMTRKEQRRLLRWRMNWLPGRKSECYCGGEMSRYHILTCPAIPPTYWDHIQRASPNNLHPFDLLLRDLPTRKPSTVEEKQILLEKWQPLWTDLLNILFLVDEICHKSQEPFEPEPDKGQLFYNWILEP